MAQSGSQGRSLKGGGQYPARVGAGALSPSIPKTFDSGVGGEPLAFKVVGPFLGLGKVKASSASLVGYPNPEGPKVQVSSSRLAPTAQGPNTKASGEQLTKVPVIEHRSGNVPLKPGLNLPKATPHQKTPLSKSPARQLTKPKKNPIPWSKVVGDRIIVGLSDFFLVLISLWVIFTAALLFSAYQEPRGLKSGIEHWLTLRPVAFLSGLEPWVGGGGILGIYFCYVVTFRIFVGQTLGKSLLKSPQTEARKGVAAPRPRENSL